MSDSSSPIKLESVSKCYRIYQKPQDRFKQAFLGRWRGGVLGANERHPTRSFYREHWALRDISLELKRGEAVGILGRNGAGKSTLLQIIAGTLKPTSGRVQTQGRITALLELGSGFNPEFTGKENVFLNASILGLTRKETEAKYDEIASFADIGDFIDQPVKTYSSGMMMRLAFAAQTAVEPKILIVDEALSVGDIFFQAKCMSRIRQLVNDGVTILFVSHDVGTIRQICNRVVLLNDGSAVSIGSTRAVTDQYVSMQIDDRNRSAREKSDRSETQPPANDVSATDDANFMFGSETFRQMAAHGRTGTQWATIKNVQMLKNGTHSIYFDFDDRVEIRILIAFDKDLDNVNVVLKIKTMQGSDIVFFDTRLQGKTALSYAANRSYLFTWRLRLPLMHGTYALSIAIAQPPIGPEHDWTFIDVVPHAFDFKMGARASGMIGGFVSLPADLDITCLDGAVGDVKFSEPAGGKNVVGR